MKLAAYIRVSTETQSEQGCSIDDQMNQIMRWAKGEGHEIVMIYTDLESSGYTEHDHPMFSEMIANALSPDHPYEGIFVHSMSRLFPNRSRMMVYEKELNECGVAVFVCAPAVT